MRRNLLTLAALLTLALAPSAWARCQQSFACAGPVCWTYLLTEEAFDEECPGTGWEDERRFTTTECSGPLTPRTDSYAMLDTVGGYTDTDHFFQDFYVPGTTGDYADMELSFSLTEVGPASWWDVVEVRVTDAATNQLLHSFQIHAHASNPVCSRLDYDISGNHKGKWLRVTFNANIFQDEVEFHIHWAEVFLNN